MSIIGLLRTEVVGQNWVTDADMSSDTFVEAPFGEDSIGGGEMLLAVKALFFERVEFWIRAYS